jgi:hypothetical protein
LNRCIGFIELSRSLVVFGILRGRAAQSFGMCYENILEVVVDFGQSCQVIVTLIDCRYVPSRPSAHLVTRIRRVLSGRRGLRVFAAEAGASRHIHSSHLIHQPAYSKRVRTTTGKFWRLHARVIPQYLVCIIVARAGMNDVFPATTCTTVQWRVEKMWRSRPDLTNTTTDVTCRENLQSIGGPSVSIRWPMDSMACLP